METTVSVELELTGDEIDFLVESLCQMKENLEDYTGINGSLQNSNVSYSRDVHIQVCRLMEKLGRVEPNLKYQFKRTFSDSIYKVSQLIRRKKEIQKTLSSAGQHALYGKDFPVEARFETKVEDYNARISAIQAKIDDSIEPVN